MATVYQAEDLKHHRQVAIKVLHPELAATLGSDRFLREIEIAAKLDHPHILALYDSGEADGLLFYVMPYVERESLRERLEREGQLPIEEALSIAAEVADGLAYAHEHSVVHRDIKPGNILLSAGHARIADFGVARALGVASEGEATATGLVLGTPVYMSPEQASGERDIDGRSDIYALACVLYEMLSGLPPFTGSTPLAVLAKRITDTPRPIRQIRQDVPPGVERALHKALATRREDRYETAGAFADSLITAAGVALRAASVARRIRYRVRTRLAGRPALASTVGAAALVTAVAIVWAAVRLGGLAPGGSGGGDAGTAPSGSAVETSVAVLYFDDLSPDSSFGVYAAGFTRSLIRTLNSVEGLSAPSLQTVRRFRNTDASPDSIARELEAEFVVEGAVLPTAGGMRVEIDLVDPQTGISMANVRQEGTPADLASLVDAVGDTLSLVLRPQLGEQVRLQQLRAGTASDQALNLVWQAEALRDDAERLIRLDDPDREGANAALVTADSLLSAAESLDSDWAEPHLLRGWVASERALVSGEKPGEYGQEDLELAAAALDFADRALGIDPDNPEALELRGTIRYGLAKREQPEAARRSLLVAAEADLRASLAAEGQRATAWRILGDLLKTYNADFEGAKQAFSRALMADRFLIDAQELTVNLIELSTDLEQYEEAWRWMLEGRRQWPDDVGFPYTAVLIMSSRYAPGDVDRAWAYWDTVQQTWPGDRKDQYLPVVYADIAAVLGLAGLKDSARAVLERGLTASPDSAFPAYSVAHAYLVLGDTAACLQWLDVDLEANPGKQARRAIEPWFSPLHGNPEFAALMAARGEVPED
jgi:serine/threonine-protein kinase